MSKIKFPKPDYKFWAKAETWSINQAAFLLHGIDPHEVRMIRLAEHRVPAEFEDVQKTYFLLRKVPWKERHGDYYLPNSGVHPIAIIFEAKAKDLPIPKALFNVVKEHYVREQERKEGLEKEEKEAEKIQHKNEKVNESFSTRERHNFLKAIGLLIKLLIDEKDKSTRANRVIKLSASQISQMMLEKAEYLGMENEGIKSFDRKITEALELIEEETTADY